MPQRRCVGCGRIAPKSELIRLAMSDRRSAAASEGDRRRAVLDRAGTMPGRGAYLCAAGAIDAPSVECATQAHRRGALARALRCAVGIDPKLLESVGR